MRPERSDQAARTRREILAVALRQFADRGYAATSVQMIATAARVTKPTLYYHFGSKAGLYQALVDLAERRFEEVVAQAASRASRLPEQLVEVCAALFEFTVNQREVVRLALGYSVLTRGAAPPQAHCAEKAQHRVAVVEKLMRRGLLDGTFRPQLKSNTLAKCFLGLVQFHGAACLASPHHRSTRVLARELVSLFLHGAALHGERWTDRGK